MQENGLNKFRPIVSSLVGNSVCSLVTKFIVTLQELFELHGLCWFMHAGCGFY